MSEEKNTEKEVTEEVNIENTSEDTVENTAEPVVELSELEQKDAKIDELNDRYLRIFSEYENFRKRTIKEKGDLISSAKANNFKVLLPILDNFDRALKSISEASDVKSLKEGVELIYSQMVTDLGKEGLSEMKVHETVFNSEEHEAITNVPAPSKKLKGKIIDVIEKGYVLNEKIIRFPKVVVGN